MVEARQRAQPRGAHLGRLVEARVLQRDGRLRGEALQQRQLLGLEAIAAGAARHDHHAAHLLADDERLGDHVADAERDELRARQRRVRIVVGDDATPLGRRHAGHALAEGEALRARLLERPRAPHQRAALVGQVDGAIAVEEPRRALDDQG